MEGLITGNDAIVMASQSAFKKKNLNSILAILIEINAMDMSLTIYTYTYHQNKQPTTRAISLLICCGRNWFPMLKAIIDYLQPFTHKIAENKILTDCIIP